MRVQQLFDKAAQNYDLNRRQLIPGFDDFYGTAIEIIPYSTDAETEILDLGAGTGLLSAMVAQAYPQATFTLVDIAGKMLEQAKQRFATEPDRFRFQVMDYAQEPLPANYHVIMSAMSIHHLTDADKLALFDRVCDHLHSGGIFINADPILGDTPAIQRFYHDTWLRKVKEQGVSQTDLSAALERMKEDKCTPLDIQLAWLRQVGLQDVHCWYKNYGVAVYSGRKRTIP